uniref:Uncharacterized protein n=1 Tax=Cacopsylla melanoneura TaxID=428564 RepID=A0A8D8V5Z8_9HEMI
MFKSVYVQTLRGIVDRRAAPQAGRTYRGRHRRSTSAKTTTSLLCGHDNATAEPFAKRTSTTRTSPGETVASLLIAVGLRVRSTPTAPCSTISSDPASVSASWR